MRVQSIFIAAKSQNVNRFYRSIYVFSYFPFGFEGMMWDLIVSVPDHCLSFYFKYYFLPHLNLLILL